MHYNIAIFWGRYGLRRPNIDAGHTDRNKIVTHELSHGLGSHERF
jgi:hypothetical protein